MRCLNLLGGKVPPLDCECGSRAATVLCDEPTADGLFGFGQIRRRRVCRLIGL